MNSTEKFPNSIVEAHKNTSAIEKELTPENIEKIIEKVKDIDKFGTAYSAIGMFPESKEEEEKADDVISSHNYKNFKDILKEGLLGKNVEIDRKYITKEKWIESVKNKTWKNDIAKGGVHFNITGRSLDVEEKKDRRLERNVDLDSFREIAFSGYGHRNVFIIFDLSSYNEVEPKYEEVEGNKIGKSNTFHAFYYSENKIYPNENHLPNFLVNKNGMMPTPNSEYGFLLHHRTAPRQFRGLVVNCWEDYYKNMSVNVEETEKRVNEIISVMKEIYKDREELMLPVYDIHGNLLWPINKNYEEVKRLTKEKK